MCVTCFDQLVALNNKVNPVLMVLTSMLMSMSILSLKLVFDIVLMSLLIENPALGSRSLLVNQWFGNCLRCLCSVYVACHYKQCH